MRFAFAAIFTSTLLALAPTALAADCISLSCSAGQGFLPCASGYKVMPGTITCLGRFSGSYTCCKPKKKNKDCAAAVKLYCTTTCNKKSQWFCRPKGMSFGACKAKLGC